MKNLLMALCVMAPISTPALGQDGPQTLVMAEREERNALKKFQEDETGNSSHRSGTINGIKYNYYIGDNGRPSVGSVGTWSVRADFDEMNDTASWFIVNDDAKLMIFPEVFGKPATFCVLFHDYPGRRAMVRIDNLPPITTTDGSCSKSARLMGDMVTGGLIRTRRYQWPYDYSQDAVGIAVNFPEAIRLYAFMVTTRFE